MHLPATWILLGRLHAAWLGSVGIDETCLCEHSWQCWGIGVLLLPGGRRFALAPRNTSTHLNLCDNALQSPLHGSEILFARLARGLDAASGTGAAAAAGPAAAQSEPPHTRSRAHHPHS